MTIESYKENRFIFPDWEVANNIKAATSTKFGGVSLDQYATFNISDNVGDLTKNVSKNREILQHKLELPSSPLWLQQVHSNKVISHTEYSNNIKADAIVCDQRNIVCGIQAADCLPIIICNENGGEIAAIHAGWKGLYKNIIKNTISRMHSNGNNLIAWIGPAISQKAYQISHALYEQFINLEPAYSMFFKKNISGQIYADLKSIAKFQLEALDIKKITIANYCTYTDNQYFYSYRKNNTTGRQATLIWIT